MSLTSETTPPAPAHTDKPPAVDEAFHGPKEAVFWSSLALVVWLVGGGTLICILLLGPNWDASDPRMPHWLTIGLLPLPTLLRLPLAVGYAMVPAVLLHAEPQLRRLVLSFILFLFVIEELAQLIATADSICFLNIVFSFLGVGLANVLAVEWRAPRDS